MTVYGWKAHIEHDWVTQCDRVTIYRRNGDGTIEVMSGWDDRGLPMFNTLRPEEASDSKGFVLPAGATEAIAELVKPGPSTAELAVLREALEVERKRVDWALTNATEQRMID